MADRETSIPKTVDQHISTDQSEVQWYVMERHEKKRRFFGTKVIETHVKSEEYPGLVVHKMPSGDIPQLKDPKLKYALRLQDAVERIGWIEETPGSHHMHFVEVGATDNGRDGQLINVTYSGTSDSFMEDLRVAGRPISESNGAH